MATSSHPPGISRKVLFKLLREEARKNIPFSVHNIIRHQVIIVQYEQNVRRKRERDVPTDLARILPQIEPLVYVWKLSTSRDRVFRFAVFLSDGDEIPLARGLRGHHRTLRNAVLKQSGSARPWTDFACRPVQVEEKTKVSDLITEDIFPFEGATLVLERDHEAILSYEAAYKESVKSYRYHEEESRLASESKPQVELATDGTAAKDSTNDEEGHPLVPNLLEQDQKSDLDLKGHEAGASTGGKRKGRAEEEASESLYSGTSGPSSASTSTSTQRPAKIQRGNEVPLDPISSEDRRQWIEYLVTSRGRAPTRNHYDLLREFLSTKGHGRHWSLGQWNSYLKDNKKYITEQAARIKRHSRK